MRWLTRLWSRRGKPAAVAPPAAAVPPPAAPGDAQADPRDVQAEPDTPSHTLLTWLLGSAAATDTPIVPGEQRALDVLDRTLALPDLPDNLLPRAAALIPQLIALMRQTSLPTPVIAERVGRDALLSAELMRLANSPYYRAQGNVANLEQAITLIGLQGLQTVIARVLLKPIYQASAGPLSARVGPRIWEHSEALARHAAILAQPAGQPVFDAYVAGLLHDTGWTVAMCVLDRGAIALEMPPSAAFAQQMTERAHRLFGMAAQRWEITPGFVAFARDARHNGVADSAHPLMPVLRWAQQHSMDELSPP